MNLNTAQKYKMGLTGKESLFNRESVNFTWTSVPNQTGCFVSSYFRSAFIEVRKKTAENAISDGFEWNFSGTAFYLAQPIGGHLIISQTRHGIIYYKMTSRSQNSQECTLLKVVLEKNPGITPSDLVPHQRDFGIQTPGALLSIASFLLVWLWTKANSLVE